MYNRRKTKCGNGFKEFYHVFGWDFLLVFTELHSPAVPQVHKIVTTWTYWSLSSLVEEGFVCTAEFSLCGCKYWPNPRECLVERLHLIKCRHFSENLQENVLCGKGRNDWFNFFLISFEIQEQTRKKLLGSSRWKNPPKTIPHIPYLKIRWSFSLVKYSVCSHREVNWQFLTSQHGLIWYFFVNTNSILSLCMCFLQPF